MAGEKIMPTGVKVISIFYYLGAAFSFLFSPIFLLSGGVGSYKFLGDAMEWLIFFVFKDWFNILLLVLNYAVAGIFLLSLGVFCIFVGRGLWKGQNWARIAAIVLIMLSILEGIFALYGLIFDTNSFRIDIVSRIFFAFIQLAVSLLIGGYLAFAHEVKEAFAQ